MIFKKEIQEHLQRIFKLKPEEQAKAQEPDYFVEKLSKKQKRELLECGTRFMELTKELRVDYWYNMKERILSSDKRFAEYDPRALNFMLDEVIKFDEEILGIIESLVGKKEE